LDSTVGSNWLLLILAEIAEGRPECRLAPSG
jgi:hypothetical protein